MKTRSPARELRQVVRTLARAAPRTAHPLAAPQQPFDSLLLARSPLYRRSRERYLAQGMSPKEAAHKTMDEVGGALIAISLVLIAVFLPTAFITGLQGSFYKQFAITIAA